MGIKYIQSTLLVVLYYQYLKVYPIIYRFMHKKLL